MFKSIAVFVLLLIAGICSAENVVIIDKDCVTLRDIFPSLSINDDIFCGLDYGQEKTINRQMSLFIINKYNIKGAQPGEVTFKRSGTLLTEDRLKEDMKNQLSMMYPDMDVTIDTIRMGRDFYIPNNMQYSIDIPQNRFGNISISLDNGVHKYTYSVSLTAYKNIFVTNGPIKRGDEILGKASLMRTDMSRIHGDPVTQLNGYIARMNIPAGRPVTSNILDRKPDALKDASVNIIYSSGSLEVSATGKLLDDAFEGESVRVQNASSGTVLRGIYKGNRTVLISNNQ